MTRTAGRAILRWTVRLAIPDAWRDTVGRDLADEAGDSVWACLVGVPRAIGIGMMLHWTFTRDTIMSDIRYAIRSLLQARWFTIGAVLTFALGIGVNIAVFSAVDRILFRPLPYANPSQLYVMREVQKGTDKGYGTMPAIFMVEARRQHSGIVDASESGFANAFATTAEPVDEPPILLTASSFNTLSVFGVHPAMGRDFTIDDARAHRSCALISTSLWRSRFGSARDIVGRQVWAAGKPTEIIGVLPADFIPASSFLSPSSDGLYLEDETLESAGPKDRSYPPYVRLKTGVTKAAAEAELQSIVEAARKTLPPPRPGAPVTEVRLFLLRDVLFGSYSDYVWLVTIAASLVLLVACGNLASLLLVRFRSRVHVTALQMALGATRGRLLRSALVESLLLSFAGGVAAIVVLEWSLAGLRTVLPPVFSRYGASIADPRVALFAALTIVSSAIIAGLVPAFRLSRVNAMAAIQQSGANARGRRLRGGRTLLAVEAALSVVLVAAAAVTVRSLVGLERNNLGFEPGRLSYVIVREPGVADPDLRFTRYMQALDVIRGLTGVQMATASNSPFLGGGTGWSAFGKGYENDGRRSSVSGDFFETHSMPALAGRTITTQDLTSHARVAVLSVDAARLLYPGTSISEVVGRYLPFSDETDRVVIGIVGDVRSSYADDATPAIYLPLEAKDMRFLDYVVKTTPGASLSVAELRARLKAQVVNPTTLKVTPVTTMLGVGLRDQKFRATLFGAFGVVALLLAALGLYAVGTFEVTLRTAEMGVRVTLGATPGHLRRLVLRESLAPVVAGVAAGLVVTYWAAKFVQAFLYHVDARDPGTYVLVAVTLVGTAALASWLPARRAARVDPAVVLRAN